MDISTILIWNVRGLKKKARRNVVRDLVASTRPKIVCLQETKVQAMTTHLLLSTLDAVFDNFVALPAAKTRGCPNSLEELGLYLIDNEGRRLLSVGSFPKW